MQKCRTGVLARIDGDEAGAVAREGQVLQRGAGRLPPPHHRRRLLTHLRHVFASALRV